MEKYNLDDKKGLLNFSSKKPSKLLSKEDTIQLKHFNNFNAIDMRIVDFTDKSVKLQCKGDVADLESKLQDHVVMNYYSGKYYFLITGIITSIQQTTPLEITVDIKNIRKTKDLLKEQKRYVSFSGTISSAKDSGARNEAIVKAMGLRAVKVSCKQDFKANDLVDVLIWLDKNVKLVFKGQIVKKEKTNDVFEYGIQVTEITESNSRLMRQYVVDAISL